MGRFRSGAACILLGIAFVGPALACSGGSQDRVHFASGSSALDAESRRWLRSVASVMKEHRELAFRLEGHSDRHGAERANWQLSLRRAESVRKFLFQDGVDQSRLTTAAFGSSRPVATCRKQACDVMNRRVVFVLTRGTLASSSCPDDPDRDY
ncbi:MAG: OmpA family protein [Parvibaculaceae bacterium]